MILVLLWVLRLWAVKFLANFYVFSKLFLKWMQNAASYTFFFNFFWKHLSCTLLANFNDSVLSSVVIMSYIRYSDPIHLVIKVGNLYQTHPIFPNPSSWQSQFYSLFLRVYFFLKKDSTFKWYHTVFVFLYLPNLFYLA